MSRIATLLSKTCRDERANRDGRPFGALRTAYSRLPAMIGTTHDWHTAKERNQLSTRYSNIEILDGSRIRFGSPMMHASRVTVTGDPICATEAPPPDHIGRYWLYVNTVKIKCIIQLCREIEQGVRKAHAYYPSEAGETKQFGTPGSPTHVKVWCIKKTLLAGMDIVTRDLAMTVGKGSEHRLRHFQYLAWPDHDIPTRPDSVHYLARTLLSYRGNSTVHCSAGVGRTGTLILAAAALHKSNTNQRIDMTDLLTRLRGERALAVQGAHQMAFARSVVFHDGVVSGRLGSVKQRADLEYIDTMSTTWAVERREERRKKSAAGGVAESSGEEGEEGEEGEDDTAPSTYPIHSDDYPQHDTADN